MKQVVLLVMIFFPFISRAQTVAIEAKTAPDKNWKTYPSLTVRDLKGFSPRKEPGIDRFGGIPGGSFKKTGFFHAEKSGERWWLITPDGNRSLNISVNDVTAGVSEKQKEAFAEKYSSKTDWAAQTKTFLTELGFNGIACWSDYKAFESLPDKKSKPLSYTIILNLMSNYGKKRGGTFKKPGHTGYPHDAIFVFDPEFEDFCRQETKKISRNRNDENLLGYFSDNELPFYKKTLDGFLSLPADDPGYLSAVKWLQLRGTEKNKITDTDRAEFLAYVADRYFSVVSDSIKSNDPNHLYLGSRLHTTEKDNPSFMRVAGKYVDVIAINYYRSWRPSDEEMADWLNWSGKPFIISEWYVKAEDSWLPNKSGAGWIVRTQKDRGVFYQNFTLALLKSKGCVGWQWFKYQDNDPENKKAEASNIDANKGIVDSSFIPYRDLTVQIREINVPIHSLIRNFTNNSK
jgi:hypothetical protein